MLKVGWRTSALWHLPTIKLPMQMTLPDTTPVPNSPAVAGCQQEPCSPSLGCSIEEFRAFVETLQVGERVIERGQSMMTGETGTVVMSRTPGHGKCVKWDTKFREGSGMVTSITGGTRRLQENAQSQATKPAPDGSR